MFDLVLADTCIGGSTVAERIASSASGLRAFYLADYSVNPLGLRSVEDVRAALERWVAFAAARAPLLVIACNTASVRLAGCPEVRERAADAGIRLLSMVDLLDRVLATTPDAVAARRVCAMGTRFTVGQPIYAQRLLAAGAREVVPLAATVTERTIAHLEHATPAGQEAIVNEIAETIRHCDSVLLACTCFPLAATVIARINPSCVQIDPAAGVDGLFSSPKSGNENVLTLGLSGAGDLDRRLRASAATLFRGWTVDRVIEVDPAESLGSPQLASRAP